MRGGVGNIGGVGARYSALKGVSRFPTMWTLSQHHSKTTSENLNLDPNLCPIGN